jgi:DNA-binding HxlR family transcriptional regulator
MDTVRQIDHHTSRVPTDCPVERTLGVLSGRWKALILYNLVAGPRRFNELRRLIPAVTQRMLTQHLRELEGDGIVARHVHNVVPPHVEYSFTPLGLTLMPILNAMAAWGLEHPTEVTGAVAA